MIARKVGRTLLGMALVFSAAACDNNPLADDRDEAAYFRLNPSNTAVNAGASIKVDAVVVNKFGAATNAPVTATACDGKLTAVADTGRTAYEFPERFVVTGVTLGASCIVVRGGGITDTVVVRVIPASLNITGVDIIRSGEQATPGVQFFNAAGQPLTGFSLADVTFTNLNPANASISSAGVISGQAPGTGRFVASLHPRWGATRVDTVTYVVQAGAFTGTVAVGSAGNATTSAPTVTFTQGALAFDTDTQVRLLLNGVLVRTHNLVTTGTTRSMILPYGLPAGVTYEIINIGPNQVATVGTLTTGTPTADPNEPDNTRAITPKVMALGETVYGSVSDADFRDYIKVVITQAGSYNVSVAWNDASDHDVYVHTEAGATLLTLEGGVTANPETGNFTVTAPGNYFVRVEVWTHDPIGGRASTYSARVIKNP